jgi:hypothetical protein
MNAVMAMAPSKQIVVGTTNVDNASLRVLSGPTTTVSGQVMPVLVEATNIGDTTWVPGTHLISLTRGQCATLPSTTAAIPAPVPPGGVMTLTYFVGCNENGVGYSAAQMRGPSGLFGQITGRSINCVVP